MKYEFRTLTSDEVKAIAAKGEYAIEGASDEFAAPTLIINGEDKDDDDYVVGDLCHLQQDMTLEQEEAIMPLLESGNNYNKSRGWRLAETMLPAPDERWKEHADDQDLNCEPRFVSRIRFNQNKRVFSINHVERVRIAKADLDPKHLEHKRGRGGMPANLAQMLARMN